ncbi:hypothetical protein [Brevundimonas sp.]|uniref:hypothetical protein n=1 Tax=Brevundimonas sp. TaxID=1871086 RepID=UPI00391A9E30
MTDTADEHPIALAPTDPAPDPQTDDDTEAEIAADDAGASAMAERAGKAQQEGADS